MKSGANRGGPVRWSGIVVLTLCAQVAVADPPPRFVDHVTQAMTEFGVPGAAIAIVEHGKITLARGFGVSEIGGTAPVTADTLFPMASVGKAFTTAALAQLVDQGKIRWDDPVIDHLPEFAMWDPWVTREITIRDLLVHRSGLGENAGDLLFFPRSQLSRAETVRRLRYLRPATGFRSGFAYDNVLYIVAGLLIERVSGLRWEDYVQTRILEPAGMTHSLSDGDRYLAVGDRAHPHARVGGRIRGMSAQRALDHQGHAGWNAAPAGGINSTANDMARWIRIQLARGLIAGGPHRLFSAESSQEMWTPVQLEPIPQLPESLAPAQPEFLAYALGWTIRDYRGTRIVMHTGSIQGFKVVIVLMPSIDVGFAILMNSEDRAFRDGISYGLLDHYLGAPPRNWLQAWKAHEARVLVEAVATLDAFPSLQAGGAAPSPAVIAGDYSDDWYGPITIRAAGPDLRVNFSGTPAMTGSLRFVRASTYAVTWDDDTIEPAYMSFAFDHAGQVTGITMAAISPLADSSYDYHDLHFHPNYTR